MDAAHEDDEVEVLRAAVTEASCSSAAALGRVQDALYAFRARLAAAFVAPSLQQHFEAVLDVADEEMTRLNAGTRALAARIRASGSVVHETAGRSAAAAAAPAAAGALPLLLPPPPPPPPPAALEQSAVGRATSVPLGELQAMLDGLEAGHVRHVLAMGSSSSSSSAFRSPSPAKRLPPPPPLQHSAPMASSSSSFTTAAAGTGGGDAASISLLLQQLASIRSTYASTHRGASPARAPAATALGPEALDALAHSPSAGASSSSSAPLAPPPPPPPQPQPQPFDSSAAAALQKLKQERRELEIELLQAHKAIGALQSRLGGR